MFPHHSLTIDTELLRSEAVKRLKGEQEEQQPKKKKTVSAAVKLLLLPSLLLILLLALHIRAVQPATCGAKAARLCPTF